MVYILHTACFLFFLFLKQACGWHCPSPRPPCLDLPVLVYQARYEAGSGSYAVFVRSPQSWCMPAYCIVILEWLDARSIRYHVGMKICILLVMQMHCEWIISHPRRLAYLLVCRDPLKCPRCPCDASHPPSERRWRHPCVQTWCLNVTKRNCVPTCVSSASLTK